MSPAVTFSLSGLNSDTKWKAYWSAINSVPEGETIFTHTAGSALTKSLSAYLLDKVGRPPQASQKTITENLQTANTFIDMEFSAYLETKDGVVRVDFSDWDPNKPVEDDITALTRRLEQFGR